MSSVWQPRWAQFLKTALSLRESTALETLPDLMPVLSVAHTGAADLYRARGERLFACGGEFTAAAGQYPTFWLGSPANSNTLVVLDQLAVASTTACRIIARTTQTPVPAGVAPTSDDARFPIATEGLSARFAFESAVAVLAAPATYRNVLIPANLSTVFQHKVVIPPGWAIQFQRPDAATDLFVWARGYERTAQPDELR